MSLRTLNSTDFKGGKAAMQRHNIIVNISKVMYGDGGVGRL